MHGNMAISTYIFEKSRKGPTFKASNRSQGYFQLVDGILEILFEIYLH